MSEHVTSAPLDDVADADAAASASARAAGVEVRELDDLTGQRAAADLLAEIWGRDGAPPLAPELLRALAKSGNYVGGAYLEDRLVGATVGFTSPDGHVLHSHIAGVAHGMGGRSIGTAMKLHQRAWTIARGIPVIEWTFDPLVARNAHFNINKLGALPVEYLADFYGPMSDAINGGDETDRLLVRWDLLSPAVAAVAAGHTPDVAGSAPGRTFVPIPPDIEALRRDDPAAARRWRREVRARLADAFGRGARVVGFDRREGYVMQSAGKRRTPEGDQG